MNFPQILRSDLLIQRIPVESRGQSGGDDKYDKDIVLVHNVSRSGCSGRFSGQAGLFVAKAMLTERRLVVHLGGIKEVDALLGGGKVTRTFRTGRRVLTALVLVVFLMPLGPAVLSTHPDDGSGNPKDDDHGGNGGVPTIPDEFVETVRTAVSCIVTCIELVTDCRAGCTPQCEAMFPGDQNAFDECWVACQESCTAMRQNCTTACRFEFTGETPELP